MRLVKDLKVTSVPKAWSGSTMTGCLDLILDRLANACKLHHTVSDLLSSFASLYGRYRWG